MIVYDFDLERDANIMQIRDEIIKMKTISKKMKTIPYDSSTVFDIESHERMLGGMSYFF